MGPAIAIAVFIAVIVGHPPHHETVVLLPDAEGKTGSIVVETEKGEEVVLNSAYSSATTNAVGSIKEEKTSEETVKQNFEVAIAAQPIKPMSFTLYFETGTDEFTPESKVEVQRMLEEMARRPSPDITVIGHTDLVGDNQSNDELSRQRAERVKTILMGMGIPADRILVAGRGKREPVVPTAEGVDEPRNRRVEINVR
jgi:outer membrane protein OmpA-like peptidoglycan-associated protein